MSCRLISLFGVAVSLLAFFATDGHVHAAATSVDLATMQKTCQVIAVVSLREGTHSAECYKKSLQDAAPKFLVRGYDCSGDYYGYAMEFEIWNYSNTASLCFYGDGSTSYLGVNIYQVNEIKNTSGEAGWFRWYPAAAYRVLSGNGGDYSWGDHDTGVEITQLCIGSTVGGHC